MKNKITFKNDEITVDMPNAVKNLNVKIVYIFPNPYQLVVKDVTFSSNKYDEINTVDIRKVNYFSIKKKGLKLINNIANVDSDYFYKNTKNKFYMSIDLKKISKLLKTNCIELHTGKISNQIKDKKESETLIQQFSELNESIKNKVDHQIVWDIVNNINSKLMASFGVEINKSPITPVSLENGRKVFEKNCSICHGLTGNGDGPMAKQLDPRPAVLSDPKLTGDNNTIPYDNFEVINVGIANTSMKPWADILSEAQIWDVTYYIRTFSNEVVQLPPVNKEMMAMEGDALSLIHI